MTPRDIGKFCTDGMHLYEIKDVYLHSGRCRVARVDQRTKRRYGGGVWPFYRFQILEDVDICDLNVFTVTQIVDARGIPSRKPCQPTTATPGTAEKVAILAARYEAQQELHHDDDYTLEFDPIAYWRLAREAQ